KPRESPRARGHRSKWRVCRVHSAAESRLPRIAWMPVPILVDEIFGRDFAQRAKPLRTIWRHPDEVAFLDRVPMFTQAIDAASFKHHKAVLHHMDVNHRETGTGLEGHSVDC